MNIALSALGGAVVSPSASKDARWSSANLIDGFSVIRGDGNIANSYGWRPDKPAFPHEIVLSFNKQAEATIAAVVIDTVTGGAASGSRVIPKDVEVWASTADAASGYTRLAALSLPATAQETRLAFTPTPARFVKIVVLSTHGNGAPEIGEVSVFEAASTASIVADLPKNLLLPALGGSLVQFSSQYRTGVAAELIDGRADYETGWISDSGPSGPATHMPQEFTFAFRDHRTAFIDRIVLDQRSGMRYYVGPRPATQFWARTVEVLTSESDPTEGFTALGTFKIPAVPKPIEVPVKRPVRYIKVRILESNGGTRTIFGEVQAFEGRGPNGQSILLAGPSKADIDRRPVGGETATRREREPNNTIAQAEALDAGASVGGGIGQGDQDFFLSKGAAGTARQAVTVDLEGRPTIRTRIGFLDAKGGARLEWDPSAVTGMRTRVTLLTDPGDVVLRLTEPPGAQVVVWDTSGSMEGRSKDLDAALRAYLKQVQPNDRVNLIRFDNTVEVLLKAFTSDRAALLAALKGKVYAGGGTAIYDAVMEAIEILEPVTGHRAIIVMTDGEDLSSRTPPPVMWRRLQEARVHLYTIGLGSGLRSFVAATGSTAEHVLMNASRATGGRYLYASSAEQLASFYQQISDELHAPPTYAIAARTSAAPGTLSVKTVGERLTAVSAPQQVELVLDASGSMRRRIGKRTMMEIAKAVLANVVKELPDNTQVALRVYGARIAEGKPGDCEDSRLVEPMGKLNRARLLKHIASTQALGTTPIAYSIEAAAKDLATRKGAKMLIVVTDGKEECGGDPEAAAKALRAKGLDVTLNIVGFGLTSDVDRQTMEKVSAAGGGRYFTAKDGNALQAALEQAMAVPFEAVDAAGQVAASGAVGTSVQVPEGVYTVRVQSAGTPLVVEQVAVMANQATTVELKKDAQQIAVAVVVPAAKTQKGKSR